MSKRKQDLYITDIVESAKKIFKYVNGLTFEEFKKDSRTFDAVIRNLEVMGEAAYNMPDVLKNQYPGIPWADISDMRNKLIHEYFGVDPSIIWKTIQEDLPVLVKRIEEIV